MPAALLDDREPDRFELLPVRFYHRSPPGGKLHKITVLGVALEDHQRTGKGLVHFKDQLPGVRAVDPGSHRRLFQGPERLDLAEQDGLAVADGGALLQLDDHATFRGDEPAFSHM